MYLLSSAVCLLSNVSLPFWYMLPYIPVLTIQLIYVIRTGTCPLVTIENYYRNKAELIEYDLGFVSYYSRRFLKINIPDRLVNFSIGIIAGIICFYFVTKYF